MPDASELTHINLRFRCRGGTRVHALMPDMTTTIQYVTACGLQIFRSAAMLTAADVTCVNHGCIRHRRTRTARRIDSPRGPYEGDARQNNLQA